MSRTFDLYLLSSTFNLSLYERISLTILMYCQGLNRIMYWDLYKSF